MPDRPSIYEQEHEDFRNTVRAFMEKEVVPFHDQWEKDGQVSREVWLRAGEQGLLCFDVEEQYGGAGIKDFRYNAIVAEEITKVGASGIGFPVHTDVIVPYISQLANEEQKQRWLPGPGQRRADLRDRDDRAGRGQRPAGHPHQRRRQGRPLRRSTAPRPSSATASCPTW